METIFNNILTIGTQAIQLILGLSLLVFVHELGHFFFARLFGMKVDKFYLFFDVGGVSLFKFKSRKTQTVYGMGWLPLGGYCKIAGMIDESYLTDGKPSEVVAYEYRSKPAWQRLLTMLGGVLFNFILALIIYTGISFTWGDMSLKSREVSAGMVFSSAAQEVGFRDGDIILSVDGEELNVLSPQFYREVIEAKSVTVRRGDSTLQIAIPNDMMRRVIAGKMGLMSMQTPFVIKETLPNGNARRAGLLPQDQVVAVNGVQTPDILDVQTQLRKHKSQDVVLTTIRGGESIPITVSVDSTGLVGAQLQGFLEVYPVRKITYSLWESIPIGWKKGITTLTGSAGDMKYVFTKEGAGQMGGFISIGKLFPQEFSWYSFWSVCALLSVIFAFMNFLPIPALDGGHILFVLWELITGRKVKENVLIRAQMIGFFFLLALLLYVNLNDIIKLF